MSFDYFYGQQSDLFTFYRVPKVLFTNERFWNISADAKMLYGILLDRMSLSAKNGWIDKNGRVYIIFTIDEAKMALNCAEQKAIKLLSELEKKAGLIERKRQGLGKPNLIYVKNFISAVDAVFGYADRQCVGSCRQCADTGSGSIPSCKGSGTAAWNHQQGQEANQPETED